MKHIVRLRSFGGNAVLAIAGVLLAFPASAAENSLFSRMNVLKNLFLEGAYGGRPPVLTPSQVAGIVVQSALTLIGVLFVILMIVAGFMWMTSGGEEEKAEKAQKMIVAAVIGLIITLGASVIWNFVVQKLITPVLS